MSNAAEKLESLLSNPLWRLNNLYKIIDKEGNSIRFKMNWAQKIMFAGMWFFNICLKARQLGSTTFWCIVALDKALFENNQQVGIIAHTREDAEEIFDNKVKYPYDNLDPDIRACLQASQDSRRKLKFSNGSSIRVGTSLRSGTLNMLIITEFGKICAKYPDKAKEIVTGSINTLQAGQLLVIESTAEGRGGYFYKYCKTAQDNKALSRMLTKLDFKFFFFPWHKHPEYVLAPLGVPIPQELHEYFTELKAKHGIELSDQQKAWYVKKYETQQDDMKQEYPSTPEEAFEAAIIGAYYAKQMLKARLEKRVCKVPHNPSKQVHTAWDLGVNDDMVIWYFQEDDTNPIFINVIDYTEGTGEGLEYYKQIMGDKGYNYGRHFAPHDIKKRDLVSGKNRIDRARDEVGIDFDRIERAQDVVEDINEVRRIFYRLRIDEERCSQGIKCLDNYRKDWDKNNACFKRTPLHNWASNGADGFRSLAHAIQDLNRGAVGFQPVRH